MMRILLQVLAVLLAATVSARADELRLVTAELPPFCFHRPPPTVSEIGEPRGLVYEVVREMARRIGHSGTVEFMGWTHAQEVALIEPNVGILALTRSPEREPFYNWMVNIVTDDLILVGGTGVDVSSLDTSGTARPACCAPAAPRHCCASTSSPASSRSARNG